MICLLLLPRFERGLFIALKHPGHKPQHELKKNSFVARFAFFFGITSWMNKVSLFLQQKKEEDDPWSPNQEYLVWALLNVEKFVWFWDHCINCVRSESSPFRHCIGDLETALLDVSFHLSSWPRFSSAWDDPINLVSLQVSGSGCLEQPLSRLWSNYHLSGTIVSSSDWDPPWIKTTGPLISVWMITRRRYIAQGKKALQAKLEWI